MDKYKLEDSKPPKRPKRRKYDPPLPSHVPAIAPTQRLFVPLLMLPYLESWSQLEGFHSFSIRPRGDGRFGFTWKSRLPDGRAIYVHGQCSTIRECLDAVDRLLEAEDWREDKYS